jgi:hypothetical protein
MNVVWLRSKSGDRTLILTQDFGSDWSAKKKGQWTEGDQ